MIRLLSYWPPYFFAGISVLSINKEFTKIVVQMKQRPWNTNYVGSHFGGSLYSMCDPFFMFILLYHLKGHIIWDKSAEIKFLKPAFGKVTATFEISKDTIVQMKKEALESFSYSPVFQASVVDSKGEAVASLRKVLYVRKKKD